MKRGQDEAGFSPDKAGKMPKFITGALSDLPDDEFKYIFGFLNHESKGNLKLTSKANEKRVMQLDPSMRDWKVDFIEDNWETEGLSLSKAKIRHTQDGTIDNIKLSLDFTHIRNDDLFYSILFLMDSVINHWKNNIVSLMILLTGNEIFLFDKSLVMPHLKHLKFVGWAQETLYTDEMVSVVLQNHSETLENLEIIDLILSLKNMKLKLKRFYGQAVPYLVADILIMSHQTLETLVWHGSNERTIPDLLNKLFENYPLHLKELDVSDISQDLVFSLLKASYKTLEHLKCQSIGHVVDMFLLDKPLLNLKTFYAKALKLQFVVSVLRFSNQTLEELEWADYNHDVEIPHDIQLRLKMFKAEKLPNELVTSVIKSTHKTLKDLTFIDIEYGDDNFNIEQQLQLERFEGENIDVNLADKVIRSTKISLKQLILCNVTNDRLLWPNRLDDLKVIYLYAKKMTSTHVAFLIDSSRSSLKELELEKIDNSVYMLQGLREDKKSEIKVLKATIVSDKLVADLIRYSHSTLKELILQDVEHDEFDISAVELCLQRFYGLGITLDMVSSVLRSLQMPLKLLHLKDIFAKIGKEDEPAVMIDPVVLKSLIQFQNSECVLDI